MIRQPFDPERDAVIQPLGRVLWKTADRQDGTPEEGFELSYPGSGPEVFPTADAAAARFTRRSANRNPKPRLFWRGRRPGMEPVQVYADLLRDKYEADRRATILKVHGKAEVDA